MTSCCAPHLDATAPDHDLFRALPTACPADRERLREILVLRYDGLVRWLAGRYATTAVDPHELRQVGYVGLMAAISRFDPDRGVDFAGFARPTVQGEIRRYFRDKRRWIQLPRRLQETKAALRDAGEALTAALGRSPTVSELAGALAVDEELVLEALTADDAFALTSLDATVGADGDPGHTVLDTLGVSEPRYAAFENYHSLRPLLAALPPRDRLILQRRFFEDRTQAEIGAEIGVSQMQVSRLLGSVLRTLRTQLEAD